MNTPRYATAAARLLAKHLPQHGASVSDAARTRGIATIELALRERSRRRWLTSAAVGVAAAALVALGTQYLRPRSAAPALPAISISATPTGRGAELRADGRAERLATSSSLRSGQHIDTPVGGGAALRLSTGTEMVLAERTSFRVDAQGALQRFSLQQGELSLHVAKLSPGQRFLLSTPDAEVEVRGTRFVVAVLDAPASCGGGSRTRVEVSEGVVEVRGEGTVRSVRAGERWPADCGASPAPRAAPMTTAEQRARAETPAQPPSPAPKRVAPRPTDTPPAKDDSPLTAQNDLFAEGVALRRQGDVRGALRAYQELIVRFPASPLAENAMVERMRLMTKSADPRASEEARRYLSRYPRGFAAPEARQLVKDQ